jgi:hypothetical protein
MISGTQPPACCSPLASRSPKYDALGHSELRVTVDFYAHLQQQTAAKAARQMDAILG